jgi:hypothetical protein
MARKRNNPAITLYRIIVPNQSTGPILANGDYIVEWYTGVFNDGPLPFVRYRNLSYDRNKPSNVQLPTELYAFTFDFFRYKTSPEEAWGVFIDDKQKDVNELENKWKYKKGLKDLAEKRFKKFEKRND